MKRRLLIVIIVASALGLAAWWWNDRLGDLSIRNRGLVRRHGTDSFDPIRWRASDKVDRGKMIADLMRKHRFIGSKNISVTDLLGPGDCYFSYEDEPCYGVEFEGRYYQLGFGVNHSNRPGEVVSVSLTSLGTD
jgi:hypothetical protein